MGITYDFWKKGRVKVEGFMISWLQRQEASRGHRQQISGSKKDGHGVSSTPLKVIIIFVPYSEDEVYNYTSDRRTPSQRPQDNKNAQNTSNDEKNSGYKMIDPVLEWKFRNYSKLIQNYYKHFYN